MPTVKIAVTIDKSLLKRLDQLVKQKCYRSRSGAVQAAIQANLDKFGRNRLARECAKLNPQFEQTLAEESIEMDLEEWPEY